MGKTRRYGRRKIIPLLNSFFKAAFYKAAFFYSIISIKSKKNRLSVNILYIALPKIDNLLIMNTQITPLALCLLLAVFMVNSFAFSAPNALKEKELNATNKAIKVTNTKPTITESTKSISTDMLVKKKEKKETSSTSVLSASESRNFEKNVNSYKQTGDLKVENNNLLENNEIILQANSASFKQGMFYGFVIMVVLLNLVCFVLFEEKAFLFYSLVVTSLASLYFYSDGLFSLLGNSIFQFNEIVQTILLLTAVLFTSIFSAGYLTLKEYFPQHKWLAFIGFGTASILLFSGWISSNSILLNLSNTVLVGLLGFYFMIGVSLFNKKNYVKFYVITYSIPLLFMVDYFVISSFGISFLGTEIFHLKVAAIAEMLIITYAIMYRMRAIKEESILRQTEMRIFLKRQETLNRQNVERLMEDMYLENLIMHYDLDGLEIKLLQYISEGKENEKIARKLKMTLEDVEELTKDLYHKLEISEHIKEDHRMVDSQPDYIYN